MAPGPVAVLMRRAQTASLPTAIRYVLTIAKAGPLSKLSSTKTESAHGKAIVVHADISREDDVNRPFASIDEQLGRIDAVVNSAGILFPQMPLEDMDANRINATLRTNVTGFSCAAVKRMSYKHGAAGGAIVNVSSAAARLGSPGEYVNYAASKGAVDTLTKGLSLEVANKGIRVNGVRPGCIYTDMHEDGGQPNRVERIKSTLPMRRSGTADEVAAAVAWLLSDEASYATGTFIALAGGK